MHLAISMFNRRWAAVLSVVSTLAVGTALGQPVAPAAKEARMSRTGDNLTGAISWLETEAQRIIRTSKRDMKDGTAAFPPQVGIGYEAFWLRDYEYALEGSIASFSDKERP